MQEQRIGAWPESGHLLPNLANPAEEFLEVVLAEALVELEALVIEDEAFANELAVRLGGPDSKLSGLGAVDPIADGDDHIETVELDLAPYRAAGLGLNSPNSLESCLWPKLACRVNLCQILTYGLRRDTEEVAHALLVQPKSLVII